MGKEKYQKKIETLFRKSLIVNSKSIERIVKDKQYTKQLIRNLMLRKKIYRLTKGCYSIYDESSLVVFCFKPAYLGLQDSLSFYNLWEQETIPIIITTRRVRQGIRNVFGINVLIRRVKKEYLFGYEFHKEGSFYLPYSDIEKTFIDMVYFKERLNEETRKNIMKKINKKKLSLYLKNYPKKFQRKIFENF